MLVTIFKTVLLRSYIKTIFRKNEWANNTNFQRYKSDRFKVHILPALIDNYMYILADYKLKIAAAVDPVEPDKVLNCLKNEDLKLTTILTTHHHLDHCGGNDKMCRVISNLNVYGGDERIISLNKKIGHNDTFKIGDLLIKCLYTPCHTLGHICYYIECDDLEPICFTGDTLFIAGCGKFLEGWALNMVNSLGILKALPENTKIYCGHEYTITNLKFAELVEPNNPSIKEKLDSCIKKRGRLEPTVPSTLKEELTYNPFLRIDEESVQLFTKQKSPISIMASLRKSKDAFKI